MAYDMPGGIDPTLYLYTSLTAGSSHIITATSRLETILKANKIPFRAIDCATDDKARSLWGRRSKGRKIPGLVKYGQVIGDLEAVEEWNEYGELKENIDNVSDLFGDTPMTDTPMPPPAPITLKDPLAKSSEPPSRSSSETRHISISEPTNREREGSASGASSNRTSKDETPLSLAMRQAGAEAAAKAGQKKAAAISSLKSSSTAGVGSGTSSVTKASTSSVPNPSGVKISAAAEDPAEDTEITAGKTPSQLASEGAKKTSIDKIAETTDAAALSSSDSEPDTKSAEEQKLEARRNSSVAKVPSRLQQEVSIDEVKTPVPEQALTSETNLSDVPIPRAGEIRPQHHRGSSLSEASKEEIKAIEEKNAIKEESEEDDDENNDLGDAPKKTTPTTKSTIQATDKAEADVMKGSNPQDQKAKDADAAGVSASTALFLSPSHNSNPNRLSTDSASVYSFFDTAFSPAPLFTGMQTLDLDLSFMQNDGTKDPRTSISTYGSDVDLDNADNTSHGMRGYDETPRQSEDTQMSTSLVQDSPRREIIPTMPTIAPLRTPARRQVSEPLLSNRISTPSSVPLPLTIRKTPTNPLTHPASDASLTSPPPNRSQPQLQTQHLQQKTSTSSMSPSSTPTSATSATPVSTTIPTPTSSSRSLRFKKSIRSLRSKKSTQLLSDSPPPELPPNLPPQRQLRDMQRSVSENYTGGKKAREKSGVKNLLCF